MRPSKNVQFSERFRAIFKSFLIVFGSFWMVFAQFFAYFRRRRRREVVFDVIVDRWIKKNSKKSFKCYWKKILAVAFEFDSSCGALWRAPQLEWNSNASFRRRVQSFSIRFQLVFDRFRFVFDWMFFLKINFDTLILHVGVRSQTVRDSGNRVAQECQKSRCSEL